MSYQALYRAWRPETFSEICGQDAVVRTLKRQVTTGHIAHAYLFCGTRGTGKTTSAQVLSRAINCLHPADGDPCGECEACLALKRENCMDVVEIDAASNNGVDEIRDLREKIKYPPVSVRYKVYIIDEVHMLSNQAFNALLKTLEEPPAHAVFILATTEPQRLPATILSRCQRYDFHRISGGVIIERLKTVLKGIGRSATDEALNEIARAAEGALRDALSLMDVCLSYTDGEVTGELARDVMGTAGRAAMFDFTDALLDGDAGKALTLIDGAMRRGRDPQVFIGDAAAHLRAVMLAGAVKQGLAELIEVTPEDAARFAGQAGRTNADAVGRMLDLFVHAEPDTRWATRPRTVLELAAVRACHPEKEADASVSERLLRVEKMVENGVPAPRAPEPVRAAETPAADAAASAAPKKAAEKKPAAPKGAEPPGAWTEGLKRLGEENPNFRKLLEYVRFAGFDGKTLTMEYDSRQVLASGVLERKKELIESAMSEAFEAPVAVVMRPEGSGPSPSGPVTGIARDTVNTVLNVFPREKIDMNDET